MYKKADFFPGSTLGPTMRPSSQPPSTQPSSKPVNKNNFTAFGNTSQQIRQGGGQFQPAQAVANFNQGYNQFLARQQARAQQQENAQRQRYEAGLRRYSVAMNNWEQGGRKGAQPTFSMADWNTLTPAELAAKPKYPSMPNLAEQWGYNYNNTPVWARDEEPQAWMYEPDGINGAYDQQQWDNWMWNLRRSGMPGGVLSTFPQTPDWDKARDVMYWRGLAEAMGGDPNKLPFVHNRGSYNMVMGLMPDGRPVAPTQIDAGTTHVPLIGDLDNYTFWKEYTNRTGAAQRALTDVGNNILHLPWNYTVGGIGIGRELGLSARAGLYDLVGADDLAKKTRQERDSEWWGPKAERTVYYPANAAADWLKSKTYQPTDMSPQEVAKMDAYARAEASPLNMAMDFLVMGNGTGTMDWSREGLQALSQRAAQQGMSAPALALTSVPTAALISASEPRDEYGRPYAFRWAERGLTGGSDPRNTQVYQKYEGAPEQMEQARQDLQELIDLENSRVELTPALRAEIQQLKEQHIINLIKARREVDSWESGLGGAYK